jgi:hypothetical protein
MRERSKTDVRQKILSVGQIPADRFFIEQNNFMGVMGEIF